MSAGWIEKQGGGLKFECTKCGKCCEQTTGIVLVNRQEQIRLANRMMMTLEKFNEIFTWSYDEHCRTLKTTPTGCILYDWNKKLCTVHGDHPLQCRTFPMWIGNVNSQEAWERTSKKCEGCNRGNFIPLEMIQRCVTATTRLNEIP